jgi:hypothetical protein
VSQDIKEKVQGVDEKEYDKGDKKNIKEKGKVVPVP